MVFMKNHTVLIVDDVEMNRLMLEEMLSPQYEIEMACNGKEALEILQKKHDEIYIVLLD